MPPVNVTDALIEYVTRVFSNRQDAINFVTDARGDMAVEGITEHDLSGVNIQQVVGQACDNAGLPRELREAVTSNPPPAHPTVNEVVHYTTQATQVVYQNDEYITQIIDQHQEINVLGDVNAPINATNDPTNVMAGEGGTAVAEEGDGDAVVASGDQSQAVNGDVNGDINNLGDGAQQVNAGGDINAPVIGGDNSGIAAGGPVTGSVAGDNTGINAGGDVSGGIVGDHNQAAQVTGSNADDAVFNFGGGSVTDVSAPVTNSAVGVEGNAQVISGNTANAGGAIGGGNTSGHFEDNDQDNDITEDNDITDNSTNVNTEVSTEVHTTTTVATDSQVSNEDGHGDADSSADITMDELAQS